METYSIKEIAEKLNTTKQRVYRCIKSNCISEVRREVVNGSTTFLYDSQAFKRISEILGVSDETVDVHQKTPNDTVLDTLLKQLETKDKQIEELHQTISNLHRLLSQEQEINARNTLMLESKSESFIDKVKRILKK